MTDFPIKTESRIRGIFEKQWIHFSFVILFTILFYYFTTLDGVITGNNAFGLSVVQLYWIAFFTPIIHQLIVWFCWRIQLYYDGMSKYLGKLGFPIYAILFSIFFVHRLLSLIMLGVANRDSLAEFQLIFWIIFVILLFPVVYLFYSVKHYFGIRRAFGMDHFEVAYQNLPMVKEGIFKYTNNGMYVFGLLILYLPGLFYASLGALLIAIFNHVYIWIHYFTVEKPDMQKIYGNKSG